MSNIEESNAQDVAPGFMDAPGRTLRDGIITYSIGFALAALLTAASFSIVRTDLIWGPGIIMALVALAIAQIGVHLVFFLHLTTAPDNTNNALALAFGVLIVTLVVGGSLWIMSHLAHNVMPDRMMTRTDLESMATDSALRVEGVVAPMGPQQVGARVSGFVTSVHCEPGMHVEAGRLCAEIDPRPFRASVDRKTEQLQAARARLDGERARLGAARGVLERAEGAQRSSVVARLRRSVERQERRVERANANVERAQAALAAAEAELAATRVVSPIEGTILSRNIEPGRQISAKAETSLFVIDPDAARIAAKADAAQADRISIGDKVVLTVHARPGQSFYGTVTKIEPAREGAQATIEMTARDPGHALEPGMTASARISKP
jgi:cytochrome o ubiquinol oxidase subunit IV